MSNIILQSAENSSLLQTLNQSDSKVIPSIYSTKEIYSPSATSWFSDLPPQSENVNAGGQMTFNIPKYGFLEQILFGFAYTYTAPSVAGTTLHLPVGVAYSMIDRIEFLSSSRVISTLYSQDLMAQHSNLSTDQLYPIRRTWAKGVKDAKVSGANDEVTDTYLLPVVFGFNQDINTIQNTSFNEPQSIRVVWSGDLANLGITVTTASSVVSKPAGGSGVVSLPRISYRYKLYNEADTAMILSENYSEPQLNMLTTRSYRENPSEMTSGVAGAFKFVINLKNVDVVNAFYIMVKPTVVTGLAGGILANVSALQTINKVTMTASGQEIAVITPEQNYYSHLTENGYSQKPIVETGFYDFGNVFKIQTGLWENSGGGTWSNGWSLREMNNVTVTVEGTSTFFSHTLTCFISETTSTILSTSSNTGRLVNSLVN
tara:strand:+ start:7553 stop:8842 length:1290 start_codon:yes stop_codon:yes gene_type:complete